MKNCNIQSLFREIALLTLVMFILAGSSHAQNRHYWHQEVYYKIDVELDVNTDKFYGKQEIEYSNNSPDTLNEIFIHLYLNAFQPGSLMDERSRAIMDPDSRVRDRIYHLNEDEIGYQNVTSILQGEKSVEYEVKGTILKAKLSNPIYPGAMETFKIEFDAQVPVQIRRAGRDNAEGIRYTMTQWYPKIAQYDRYGWHATQYVAREFYGVWGTYEVNITLDSDYIIGGTGVLQNAAEIGYGYDGIEGKVNKNADVLTWKFKAENVHDFAWAADPDYTHRVVKADIGIDMHFFYKDEEDSRENWERLPEAMNAMFSYLNENNGEYPYSQYSFIQGGDGGMEYPMATMITGGRSYRGLVGVSVHELLHSWYQGVIATDETRFPWVDEGFTSYYSSHVINHLIEKGILEGRPVADPFKRNIQNYVNFLSSGLEEPMSTLADHFDTNTAYGVSSYVKGGVFLHGLKYIMGAEKFNKGMRIYYNRWKFKHPEPYDFIRIMEEVSGLQLDWYLENMMNTLKQLDYAVDGLTAENNTVKVRLKNHGTLPMPVDLVVKLKDGSEHFYTIPLMMMFGHKDVTELKAYASANVLRDWAWTAPVYEFNLPFDISQIEEIVLDPMEMLPDTDRSNNHYPPLEEVD